MPWICPRCQVVNADWVAQCSCQPPVITRTATTTEPTYPTPVCTCWNGSRCAIHGGNTWTVCDGDSASPQEPTR